jgi:transposase-like protein
MGEEQIVQKFPRRCPYCERELVEDGSLAKRGREEQICPHCGKVFVRLSWEEAAKLGEEMKKHGIERGGSRP